MTTARSNDSSDGLPLDAFPVHLDLVGEAAILLVMAKSQQQPRSGLRCDALSHDQAVAQALREGARILAERVLQDRAWGCRAGRPIHARIAPPAEEVLGPVAATLPIDSVTHAALGVVMTQHAFDLRQAVALAAAEGARALGLLALPPARFAHVLAGEDFGVDTTG
jgi:hypothetical protein